MRPAVIVPVAGKRSGSWCVGLATADARCFRTRGRLMVKGGPVSLRGGYPLASAVFQKMRVRRLRRMAPPQPLPWPGPNPLPGARSSRFRAMMPLMRRAGRPAPGALAAAPGPGPNPMPRPKPQPYPWPHPWPPKPRPWPLPPPCRRAGPLAGKPRPNPRLVKKGIHTSVVVAGWPVPSFVQGRSPARMRVCSCVCMSRAN